MKKVKAKQILDGIEFPGYDDPAPFRDDEFSGTTKESLTAALNSAIKLIKARSADASYSEFYAWGNIEHYLKEAVRFTCDFMDNDSDSSIAMAIASISDARTAEYKVSSNRDVTQPLYKLIMGLYL